MRQAQTGVANGMGLARTGLASLAMAVLIAPQASTEMRLALNATVSTQCAIADIDSEAWADGVLRVSAQCNAQSYCIRLISGDTEIDLASVSLVEPGADVRLRSGDAWVTQDRPGNRDIEIGVDAPFALAGPISIRLDTL